MAQDYEDTCPRIADDVSCHFALVRTNGADRMTDVVADALATAASAETARIVSTLIRMTGDFTLAEDCLQDAFAKALVDWRANTIPENPGAWLTTVAKNRAIDVLRRVAAERRALHRVSREPEELVKVEMPEGESAGALAHPDDRLSLIFTCCHPRSVDGRQSCLDPAHGRRSQPGTDRARISCNGVNDGESPGQSNRVPACP